MFKPGDLLVIDWDNPFNLDLGFARNDKDHAYNHVFEFVRYHSYTNRYCDVISYEGIEDRYHVIRFKLYTKYANTTLLTGGNI